MAAHMSEATLQIARRGWPIALAVLAFVGGWAAFGLFNRAPSTGLSIEGQIQGVVSSANFNSSGICIESDSDHKQYCSEPLQVPGVAALQVGERIVVAVALVDLGGGSGVEVYIVTSPAPPHG